jgi:hypothetical protein
MDRPLKSFRWSKRRESRADRAFKAIADPRSHCRAFKPETGINFDDGEAIGSVTEGRSRAEGEGEMMHEPKACGW